MNSTQNRITSTRNVRLNKYVLLEEIGRGGHGVVYKGYHKEKTDKIVAVKIINNTGNIDSLLVEPELLSRLNHPNIINLKDYFIHEGKLILVTEYIDGITLQSYLEQRGKFSTTEVKTFLAQIADALAHAHANNVIHRDIKLSNILVTGDHQNRRFVLVDFGISRMAEGIQTIKRVAGTYYYMAPEQLRGRPCEQSDLWALGVCAYSLLTGIKPFEGDTQQDLSKKILLGIPQPPSEVLEEIDPDFDYILFHLLEKELVNRTSSAHALLDELKKWSKSTVTKIIKNKDFKSKNSLPTWEKKERAELKKNWRRFWIYSVLSNLSSVIVPDAMLLGGLIIFYLGQEKSNFFKTFIGIFFMIIGRLIHYCVIYFVLLNIVGVNEISGDSFFEVFQEISILQQLWQVFFILIAVHYLTKIRNLRESLLLHKTLREASQDINRIIQLLKSFVNTNWGNMNLRQKYIELLLFNGQIEDAIVESKLALEVDPYNFGLTLLLANSYFEVGLYEECKQVCDYYLAISTYSFEFSDIKERCQLNMEK
ncbi:serine/threonine-protein kinase [Moorena sp. SIO3H5]|uniref:serine/threonine protein kinase n=1 Tax=Moorena sp. SIO3H5 TaxID=2607834 RepID=UPI0013B72EFE|nr:serine/threonine-protein kinase [Moorena sp. SIO3H5]NEO72629.1 serine/threonine protein kinase [Moorena sp. SIO3H5]